MTPSRLLVLALCALAVIGGAAWLSSQRHLERSIDAGALFLPGLQQAVNEVTEIRIAQAGNRAVTLRREANGWRVAERKFAADGGAVRKLLLDLAQLRVIEQKTSDPKRYAALGVEPLSLSTAAGTELALNAAGRSWSLVLGKSVAPDRIYARLTAAQDSFLVSPEPAHDATPGRWLDTRLLDISSDRVKSVTIERSGSAAYTVARATAKDVGFSVAPLPKGRRLTADTAAAPIVEALVDLRLEDVHAAADAASPPPATATYTTFDGLVLKIAGRQEAQLQAIRISASAAAGSSAEIASAARELEQRSAGLEFDLPQYKYSAIFKPLEELLQSR